MYHLLRKKIYVNRKTLVKRFGSVKQYINNIIGLRHDGSNSFIILTHWLSVIQQIVWQCTRQNRKTHMSPTMDQKK
jgi:hypothetical protein